MKRQLLEFESLESRCLLTSGPIDTLDRAAVIAAYASQFKPYIDVPVEWTGSVNGCVAGTVSPRSTEATLNVLNFLRNLAGVHSVLLDETFSERAQQAALMMHAENSLSHSPGRDWACYSAAGAQGAGASNLYLGVTGPTAMVGYVEDPGSGNYPVGHRRWLLNPHVAQMGIGSTSRANALYVFGQRETRPAPDWLAWPPQGHVPKELIFPRWSLSRAGANFTDAKVQMVLHGQSVPLEVQPVVDGFAMNTLVWEPSITMDMVSAEEFTVDVLVENVRVDGVATSFRYTVTPIQPGPPVQTIVSAQDDRFAMTAGRPSIYFDVLANDDLNNADWAPATADSLAATIVGNPSNGYLLPAVGNPGILFYFPNEGFVGVDTFSYRVADLEAGRVSNLAHVQITVGAGASPTNQPPTISNISNLSGTAGIATDRISFSVGDAETAASNLIVTATSANQTLIPHRNITLAGSGANRTVTITPAAGQSGSDTITLWVSDGVNTTFESFVVTSELPPVETILIDEDFENGTVSGFTLIPEPSESARISAGESFGRGDHAYQMTHEHEEESLLLQKWGFESETLGVEFAVRLPDGIPNETTLQPWANLKNFHVWTTSEREVPIGLISSFNKHNAARPDGTDLWQYNTYSHYDDRAWHVEIEPPIDEWLHVRYFMRWNQPGTADGQLMIWLNNELVVEADDVEWLGTEEDFLDGVRIGGNLSLGGEKPDHPFRRWVDDVVVVANGDVPVVNTLPASSVNPLPEAVLPRFDVAWSSPRTSTGLEVDFYDIYVSTNSGSYELWLEETSQTSGTFEGVFGNSYSFYSIATDVAGNRERKTPLAEATTAVRLRSLWQNPSIPLDVDADLSVSPIDALVIINVLNSSGATLLRHTTWVPSPYIDVNGDEVVSPLDVLVVINYLNEKSSGSAGEGEQNLATQSLLDAIPFPVGLPLHTESLPWLLRLSASLDDAPLLAKSIDIGSRKPSSHSFEFDEENEVQFKRLLIDNEFMLLGMSDALQPKDCFLQKEDNEILDLLADLVRGRLRNLTFDEELVSDL